MQLPRGTFREIRKKILVSNLLNEIEVKGFSGICTISYGNGTGTVVFRSGIGILAKLPDSAGDAAWQKLQQMHDKEVDAAFSLLDETQMRLALEFNKPSKITGTEVKAHSPNSGQLSVHHQPAKKSSAHPPVIVLSEVTEKLDHDHSNYHAANHRAVRETAASQSPVTPGALREGEKPEEIIIKSHYPRGNEIKSQGADNDIRDSTCPEPDSFEKDIDTISGMDLDNMSEKIRTDCKTIVKQLNLEHLMER